MNPQDCGRRMDVMKVPILLKQGRKMKAIKIRRDHFERKGMKQYY
jgi:hypothetical protein